MDIRPSISLKVCFDIIDKINLVTNPKIRSTSGNNELKTGPEIKAYLMFF